LREIFGLTLEHSSTGDASAYTKKMSTGLSCTRVAILAVTETAEIVSHSKLTHRGVIEDNAAYPCACAGIAQIWKPRTSGKVRGDARFVLLSKQKSVSAQKAAASSSSSGSLAAKLGCLSFHQSPGAFRTRPVRLGTLGGEEGTPAVGGVTGRGVGD
jgi:hypothetical protein